MDTCGVNEPLCAARRRGHGATMVTCHCCGNTACLSCAVRVPLSGREEWCCHPCAERLSGAGAERVRAHRSLLGVRAVTMDSSRGGPKPAPTFRSEAWTGGARRGWRNAYPTALTAPAPAPAAPREPPARPRPYPKRRMEILGYAR